MTDIVSPQKRSQMMSGIRGKNTKPELQIRRALHARGFRYRLHKRNLPGKPDLTLQKYNAIIFVHGCFWHLHNCHLFKWPSTRPEFWKKKISGNKIKDEENIASLKKSGWRILIIWECALKGKERLDFDSVIGKIDNWLRSSQKFLEIKGNSNE